MAKAPKQNDYGGNAYLRGRKRHRMKGNRHSFRCVDCETLRYVLPKELNRAAQPRCLRCGGRLERTATEQNRHKSQCRPAQQATHYRCRACGCNLGAFRAQNLVAHLLTDRDCLHEFISDGYLMPCGMIFGTLYIEKAAGWKPWEVFGLKSNRELTKILEFATRWQAEEWIEKQNNIFEGIEEWTQ